jgi:hypothetical protein
MVQPVCPQLRKCRVRPGSYAWCQYPTFIAFPDRCSRPTLNPSARGTQIKDVAEAEFRLSSSSRTAYQRVPRTPTGKVHKPRLCQTPTATSPSTSAPVKGDRRNSCPVTCYRSLTVKRNTDRSLDEGSYSAGAELWVD